VPVLPATSAVLPNCVRIAVPVPVPDCHASSTYGVKPCRWGQVWARFDLAVTGSLVA